MAKHGMMLWLWLIASSAQAGGLTTPFGEVAVRNVAIGETYNLRELVGIPFRIINTAQTAEEVLVDPMVPEPGETIKEGYERIPDASWIRLTQREFILAPGQEGVADVIVSIPKDPRHLGRKYQAHIWSHVNPKGRFVVPGLKSRLLIHISPTVETKVRREQARALAQNLNFSLMPFTLTLDRFPLGSKIRVNERYGQGFKIINVNKVALKVEAESIPRRQSYFDRPEGFEDGDAAWLRVRNPVLKAAPNSIEEIRMVLEIPERPEHRGKRFIFVIRAVLKDQAVPVSAFGKLLVETEK